MIAVEFEKIELDYCPNCSGVWFDSGELELLLNRAGLSGEKSTLLPTPAVTTEKNRRCPICRQKMDKGNIGQEPKVLVDTCPDKHGIWFDGGEIGQLFGKYAGKAGAGSPSEQQVVDFVKNTLNAKSKSGANR